MEVAKTEIKRSAKYFLSFIVTSRKEVSSRSRESDRLGKNEGEPLHIASPSTIPLTLGEEMAVLLLPLGLYQKFY